MGRVARRIDDDIVALRGERAERLVDDARVLQRAAALQRKIATLEYAFGCFHATSSRPERSGVEGPLLFFVEPMNRSLHFASLRSAAVGMTGLLLLTPGSARSRAARRCNPWRRTSNAAADGGVPRAGCGRRCWGTGDARRGRAGSTSGSARPDC